MNQAPPRKCGAGQVHQRKQTSLQNSYRESARDESDDTHEFDDVRSEANYGGPQDSEQVAREMDLLQRRIAQTLVKKASRNKKIDNKSND